jgi:hypothetical protein
MRMFWEELGIVGTTEGKNFNASAWALNMKNKLHWRDRMDVTSDDKQLPTPIYAGKSTEVSDG